MHIRKICGRRGSQDASLVHVIGFPAGIGILCCGRSFLRILFTIDCSISIGPPEHTAAPEGPRVPAGGEALGYLSLIASRQ